MKRVNCYLFLLTILMLACEDVTTDEIQSVKDGEYIIKLYNDNGDLLLTKRGNAENLVADNIYSWEIRFLDPLFGMQNSDPLETFASLTVFGKSSINKPQELFFNNDNIAVLHQQWYSLGDDWGYRSTKGTMNITQIEKFRIKGNFEINLEVDGSAQQNPKWGERIFVKGYFSSVCPYEEYGGCE